MLFVSRFTFVVLMLLFSTAHALPPAPQDSDFYDGGRPARAKVALGRQLFYDKILSGNRNISCATCHHALADTGDGLSLPVGEGGHGLGVTRDTGVGNGSIHERVPRNAPPLFNLGAREFTTLFHDGRLVQDATQPSGFLNPAGDELPLGLDNVLAAQAMFPVTSATEMAGQFGENPIADAAVAGDLAGPNGVWAQLADRLRSVPQYARGFALAFDTVHSAQDITFVHAANAIAAFEATAFRADASPFDQFLRGDEEALSERARSGMILFYGEAGCGACHSGVFQTNHQFAAIAMPQIGPGKGDGFMGHDDFGRERVTLAAQDKYRFRVPTLRNVALTGPWGHDGALPTLESVVRHHLDPLTSLDKYAPGDATLPPRADLSALDYLVHNDQASRTALAAACELTPTPLSDHHVGLLVSFLHALTDRSSVDLRHTVPLRVPSGAPIAD